MHPPLVKVPALFPQKNIHVAFGTKHASLHDFVAAGFPIHAKTERWVRLHQVHHKNILLLEQASKDMSQKNAYNAHPYYGDYDGVITPLRHYTLCISTADCIPVLMYAPKPPLIVALHVGWKPLYRGLLSHAASMLKHVTSLKSIHILLGPGISKEAYIVKRDLLEAFLPFLKAYHLESTSFFTATSQENHYHMDLKKLIQEVLIKETFQKKHILDIQRCTFKEASLFHSHRRTGTEKRLLSMIRLRDR